MILGLARVGTVWQSPVKSWQNGHGSMVAGKICYPILTWMNDSIPDSKVHGANMGPTSVLLAPDGPHVGPLNLVIRDCFLVFIIVSWGMTQGSIRYTFGSLITRLYGISALIVSHMFAALWSDQHFWAYSPLEPSDGAFELTHGSACIIGW